MSQDEVPLPPLPRSLADIVRRNRDLFEVGLATAAEVAAVTGGVDAVAVPRGRLEWWRMVALRDHVARRVTLHVLGHLGPAHPCMTSEVAVLASDAAMVRTRNSVYLLGSEGQGEPDPLQLLHLAFTLHRWGLNSRYGLDVIEVDYE
jgi:hypothetical protein